MSINVLVVSIVQVENNWMGSGEEPVSKYNQAIVVLTENLCWLVCLFVCVSECGIKSCRVCIRFHFQLLQVKV